MLASPDPVGAVLAAHDRGDLISLRTSGTTGPARAVVRTTGSWVRSFAHVAALTGLEAGSRVWVPGPLTSTMNLFAAVHTAYLGARVVDGPDDATHAHVTPQVLARALDRGVPLSGRQVVVAGDRLSEALAERATRAGAVVGHYYGAAELSFVAWGTHEGNLQPFPEVETSLRDRVLWVRSPYLCEGYDGRPGLFRRDAAGFATVGDQAVVENGYVRVLGRGDDTVVTGSATVLVGDVEEALRPSVVGELVVVGLPHDELGAVLAGVLTDAAAFPTARAAARERLEGPHRPRLWFHVPELPVTTAGKVDRAAVADLLVSPDESVHRLV